MNTVCTLQSRVYTLIMSREGDQDYDCRAETRPALVANVTYAGFVVRLADTT